VATGQSGVGTIACKGSKDVDVLHEVTARRLRKDVAIADIPIWPGIMVALLVGIVYLSVASAGTFHFRPSRFPHHVLVADAWLHGQLYVRDDAIQALNDRFYRDYRASLERALAGRGGELTEARWEQVRSGMTPPGAPDWSVVDGRRYGYWGPLVPLMLLPYVAVAGLQTSDMLFSCLIGTGTVLLTFLMLRQAHRAGFIPLSTATCVGLTLLLGLGTVHFYLAATGQVWFLSQIVAAFFLTLGICFVLRSREGLGWSVAAGAAFGAALLARSFIFPAVLFFFVAIIAARQHAAVPPPWRETMRHALGFSMPVLLAVGIIFAFNYARFGDILESGVNIQIETVGNHRFRQDYLQYGLFSLHYLSRNVYFYFFNPILVRYPTTQALTFHPDGNSMFLVTPALLYVFPSHRRRSWFTLGLWVGVVPCVFMLLLFNGTGWYQFGNRYLLDVMPFLVLLIATGMDGRLTWRSATLIALSIMVNAWGTYHFCAEQS
jgi:hypothetical protein